MDYGNPNNTHDYGGRYENFDLRDASLYYNGKFYYLYYYYYHIDEPFSYITRYWINFCVQDCLTTIVAFFGLISKCINIAIFYRQGPLSHSCTVGLLGFGVTDSCFCFFIVSGTVFEVLQNFHYYTVIEWNWNPFDFVIYITSKQQLVLSQIGGGVTAFLSVERFISVMFPFRVKAVFTPKRSCVVIICIYIGVILLWGTNSIMRRPEWEWDSERNKSVLVFNRIYFSNTLLAILNFTSFVNGTILPPLGVVLVLICNVVIYWKVNMSKQFRKVSASTTTHNSSSFCHDPNSSRQKGNKEETYQKTKTDVTYNSKKELNLFRMLTVVCLIYGITYTVSFIRDLIFYNMGLHVHVDYHVYTSNTTMEVAILFQSINASCNIIIYYTMNSRYRKDLQLLLCHWKREKMSYEN